MFHLIVLATVMSACLADDKAQPVASAYTVHNDYRRLEDRRLQEGLERLRQDLNVPVNPHRHLDDRYHQEEHHREEHHRDEHDRDEHYRDEHHRGEHWEDHKVKSEKKFWTNKDRIEHEDDDEETRPVILQHIKSTNEHHMPDIARQNKIIKEVYSPDYAEPTWIIDYRYLKSGGRDYTRGPGGQILILPKGIKTNEHKEYRNYDELIEALRKKNLEERAKPQYFMPLGQEVQEHREKWNDDKKWYN